MSHSKSDSITDAGKEPVRKSQDAPREPLIPDEMIQKMLSPFTNAVDEEEKPKSRIRRFFAARRPGAKRREAEKQAEKQRTQEEEAMAAHDYFINVICPTLRANQERAQAAGPPAEEYPLEDMRVIDSNGVEFVELTPPPPVHQKLEPRLSGAPPYKAPVYEKSRNATESQCTRQNDRSLPAGDGTSTAPTRADDKDKSD
ncbi:hypothetical protein C8035_v001377 [Colletotrichum spinosum]|uniref:Uncharacterized protein n=1 Tax=Colletotrichum spinosum TaxID=1347390 RepID=A0A4R8PZY8_9PEZI|nr:hypothetical protein C8035_v001377 [Colletotrichum spinosum]